jgi:hypothetical protein
MRSNGYEGETAVNIDENNAVASHGLRGKGEARAMQTGQRVAYSLTEERRKADKLGGDKKRRGGNVEKGEMELWYTPGGRGGTSRP